MGFEIEPVSVDVPTLLSPQEEVQSIVDNYSLGIALREVGLYRIWRIWKDNIHLEILSDDPNASANQPMFPTWSEFVKFLTMSMDVSRSKIYSRLKVYSLLSFLDYSDSRMINMMSNKPGLYERVVNVIFIWDQDARIPTGLKTDKFGDDVNDEETKANIRSFIDSLDGMASISDAIDHLMHDIMHQPVVRLKMIDDIFAVYYSATYFDEDTETEVTGDSGEIYFESESIIPDWVMDELRRKYGSRA